MASFWKSRSTSQELPPEKKISTPAGQRLSVILDAGGTSAVKTRESHRASLRKSSAIGVVPLEEGAEEASEKSNGHSCSAWSEASGEKLGAIKNNKHTAKKGGWKRLALISAVLLLVIVGAILGGVLGSRKKSSRSKSSVADGSNLSASPARPSDSSAVPPNFPLGSYSMVTFLDTVQTNCTSNPDTWTCFPYITYNEDSEKAKMTFNWVITGSPGSYRITSTGNPSIVTFRDEALRLLDEGKDTERYRFQLTMTKEVTPTTALTKDGSSAACTYSATTFQAFLYTKMEKSYPETSELPADAWPYRVRVEQVTGGGADVPKCYKTNSGGTSERISDGLSAQDQGNLCSCLYKNWRTS